MPALWKRRRLIGEKLNNGMSTARDSRDGIELNRTSSAKHDFRRHSRYAFPIVLSEQCSDLREDVACTTPPISKCARAPAEWLIRRHPAGLQRKGRLTDGDLRWPP